MEASRWLLADCSTCPNNVGLHPGVRRDDGVVTGGQPVFVRSSLNASSFRNECEISKSINELIR
jgi:hypothetical protein